MIEAGEDPRFIARRLVILASEDIGLADPTALTTAVAAAQAVAADRDARGPAEPRPGHDRAGGGAEVERRDHGDRRRQRRRARRQDRAGARPPARRPLPRGADSSATGRRTSTATTSRSASPSSSTPPTWSPTRRTTSRPRSAPRPRSRSAGSGIRRLIRGGAAGQAGTIGFGVVMQDWILPALVGCARPGHGGAGRARWPGSARGPAAGGSRLARREQRRTELPVERLDARGGRPSRDRRPRGPEFVITDLGRTASRAARGRRRCRRGSTAGCSPTSCSRETVVKTARPGPRRAPGAGPGEPLPDPLRDDQREMKRSRKQRRAGAAGGPALPPGPSGAPGRTPHEPEPLVRRRGRRRGLRDDRGRDGWPRASPSTGCRTAADGLAAGGPGLPRRGATGRRREGKPSCASGSVWCLMGARREAGRPSAPTPARHEEGTT